MFCLRKSVHVFLNVLCEEIGLTIDTTVTLRCDNFDSRLA